MKRLISILLAMLIFVSGQVPAAAADLSPLLREFDELLLDDDLVSWLAGLYDAELGSFYYTESARDNPGFYPTIECLNWALSPINLLKLNKNGTALTRFMKKAAEFVKLRQSSSDGYFYDPQFGTNVTDTKKHRDLSAALAILRWAGEKPLYLTPAERLSMQTADSGIPTYLESEAALRAWLDTLDFNNDPYHACDSVSVIKSMVDSLGYTEIVLDYLIEKQNKSTGLWGISLNSDAVNGALKATAYFNRQTTPYPLISKAIESVTYVIKNAGPGKNIAEVWNRLAVIKNSMDSYPSFDASLRAEIDDALYELLSITLTHTRMYRREDGGYSNGIEKSVVTASGAVMSLGLAEGDLNGTALVCSIVSTAYALAGKKMSLTSTHTEFLQSITAQEPQKPVKITFEKIVENGSNILAPCRKLEKAEYIVKAESEDIMPKAALIVCRYRKDSLEDVTVSSMQDGLLSFKKKLDMTKNTDLSDCRVCAYVWNGMRSLGGASEISSSDKEIISFSVNGKPARVYNGTGEIFVEYNGLAAPQITQSGGSISPPASVVQDFSKPVTYTVTGVDGVANTYTVNPAARFSDNIENKSDWKLTVGSVSAGGSLAAEVIREGTGNVLRISDLDGIVASGKGGSISAKRTVKTGTAAYIGGSLTAEMRIRFNTKPDASMTDYGIESVFIRTGYKNENIIETYGVGSVMAWYGRYSLGGTSCKILPVREGKWYTFRVVFRVSRNIANPAYCKKYESEIYIAEDGGEFLHNPDADNTFRYGREKNIRWETEVISFETRKIGKLTADIDCVKVY